MLTSEFKDQIIQLLQGSIQQLTPIDRHEDLKRSKDRNISLYTINDLDDVTYHDEDFVNILRYVVTTDHRLVLGEAGRPSKSIPQNIEMTKSSGCIAAGKIYLSNENPQRILAIDHDSRDYEPDITSLLWPLIALDLHPTLIHPDFKIRIGEYNMRKQFIITDKFAMNAQTLHDFLADIESHCPVHHTNLKASVAAADLLAQKDSIIYTAPQQHHHSTRHVEMNDHISSHALSTMRSLEEITLSHSDAQAMLAHNRATLQARIQRIQSTASANIGKRKLGLFQDTDTTSSESSYEDLSKITRLNSAPDLDSYISSSDDDEELTSISRSTSSNGR